MRALKLIAQLLGLLLLLAGGFFALQGAGVIMWPATSPMLADGSWVVNGIVIAAVGALLLWWASRRPLA